jgi:hypothetical protein
MKNMLHEGNNLKDNFYAIKFMMKPLGLGYKKKNNPKFYMLYNGEYTNFTECKTYKHAWYKPKNGRGKTLIAYKKIRCLPITPMLQKLFMSLKTVKRITWYHSHDEVYEVMVHLFDGQTWKQFNRVHP